MLGYRGTGKSVISKLLSEKLRMKLYKIDKMVSELAGKSIPEIVEQEGWVRFREIERGVVQQISSEVRNSIIDCGGGVVMDERNVADLRRNGKVVLLTSSLEKIIQRISRDSSRPPLEGNLSFREGQQKVLMERDPKYRAAADCIFDTTHLEPRQTALKIITCFKKERWI